MHLTHEFVLKVVNNSFYSLLIKCYIVFRNNIKMHVNKYCCIRCLLKTAFMQPTSIYIYTLYNIKCYIFYARSGIRVNIYFSLRVLLCYDRCATCDDLILSCLTHYARHENNTTTYTVTGWFKIEYAMVLRHRRWIMLIGDSGELTLSPWVITEPVFNFLKGYEHVLLEMWVIHQ